LGALPAYPWRARGVFGPRGHTRCTGHEAFSDGVCSKRSHDPAKSRRQLPTQRSATSILPRTHGLNPKAYNKKQYSTPKVSVGTVKKSIAAMASRWFLRNVSERLAKSGFLGTCRTHRETVLSDTLKPSFNSSPWMRGAPKVGFSATMRKIRARISLLTHFRPPVCRALESHFQ
jgi:hypothetical protein